MNDSRPYSINALELGPMENFIYIIQDHSSKTAAVVDPAWEVEKVIALMQHQGFKITEVLLTHSHHDHTNGLDDLLAVCDAKVHLLKAEAQFWAYGFDKPTIHYGGDTIQLGKTSIEIWHTPGHTPGSACYYLDGHLLTGDTLFVYGCGRCDLSGGDPEQMYHSLQKLVTQLPPTTVIHPGHHYAHQPSSTLAEQLEGNPFLHFANLADFVHYRMHGYNRQPPFTPVTQ